MISVPRLCKGDLKLHYHSFSWCLFDVTYVSHIFDSLNFVYKTATTGMHVVLDTLQTFLFFFSLFKGYLEFLKFKIKSKWNISHGGLSLFRRTKHIFVHFKSVLQYCIIKVNWWYHILKLDTTIAVPWLFQKTSICQFRGISSYMDYMPNVDDSLIFESLKNIMIPAW